MVTLTQQNDKPVLPDFTRWQWAGVPERLWYLSLVQGASRAFDALERISVVEGMRKAAFQFVYLNDIERQSNWAHRNGLVMVPVTGAHQGNNYSASSVNGPYNSIRVVYIHPEDYSRLLPFTDNGTGELLGFPECCRKHFAETWGKGQVDSTWEEQHGQLKQAVSPYASVLMRWMGVRFVAHMPCSPTCAASIDIGKAFYDLGIKHGFEEEMQFAKEMLTWPVLWTRRFGIAEITTPALKLVVRSDWTPDLQQFSRSGTYIKPLTSWWEDNGFKEPDAMRSAHKLLIDALREELPTGARVFDLGCGNGLLLRRLKKYRPDIQIGGIDIKENAIHTAQAWLSGKWYTGKIQDGAWREWNPDVVLINPVRLSEMKRKVAADTKRLLKGIPVKVFYAYSDVVNKLEDVIRNERLGATRGILRTPEVAAVVAGNLSA